MIVLLMMWFLPINFLIFCFLFGVSVGVRTLQCLHMILMPLHLLYHLQSLLPLKRLLFSSLWMRWGHFLCSRPTFSSTFSRSPGVSHSSISISFMDNASSLSTLAFHICFHLYHHHHHHLISFFFFMFVLDTPTFTALCSFIFYFGLCRCLWMFVMILDYVFVLDYVDLIWLLLCFG